MFSKDFYDPVDSLLSDVLHGGMAMNTVLEVLHQTLWKFCIWLFVFTVTTKLVLALKKKGSINNEYRKRSPGHQRCGGKEYMYTHA